MRKHIPFLAILSAYFLVAGLFAIRVPAWQAPDEPAHYNVVRQVAQNGCCPLLENGDWDSPTLDALKTWKFAGTGYGMGYNGLDLVIPLIQYEDHQPPLYYMLLAPVYSASGGSLTAMRLASVVIGAGVVIAAYAVSLRAFRGNFSVAWAAAAFVAFLPQHVHILASVNNDALAWALCGAILWASIDYADGGKTPAWALGLLVGAALLTKSTAYMMGGVAFVAIVLGESGEGIGQRTEQKAKSQQPTARGFFSPLSTLHFFSFLLPAAVLGLLWWGRNFGVYGFPDFLGLRRHDAVVIGQLRTADRIATIGLSNYLSEALQLTLTSFYGMFGWMAAPLPLWATAGFLGLTVVGILSAGLSPISRSAARGTWRIFGLTALLAILMLIYYNTSFVQFQGRYAYPLLIPLAVTVALGLDFIRERLPVARNYVWLTAGALSLVALLDIWLLARVIVPNLAP